MKIGVFGDSFAEKWYQKDNKIWYNFLQNEYGHTVESFGESGSSILFSAELIKKHAKNYDLAIWCVTTPGRISLPHADHLNPDHSYHISTSNDRCFNPDREVAVKHQVCADYLKYIFNWESENLVSLALVKYIQQEHKNLLIISCFPPPLSAEFNLYEASQREANFYFPGMELSEIYKTHDDLRCGHISVENQKILAKLINDNLTPGVFHTSYDNFVKPPMPIEQLFKKL